LQEACKCHNVPPPSTINEKKRNIWSTKVNVTMSPLYNDYMQIKFF
jgi:hypothetical protein